MSTTSDIASPPTALRTRLQDIIGAQINGIPSADYLNAVSDDVLDAVREALLSGSVLDTLALAIARTHPQDQADHPADFLPLARHTMAAALDDAFAEQSA
jgi:hypothetical protein